MKNIIKVLSESYDIRDRNKWIWVYKRSRREGNDMKLGGWKNLFSKNDIKE